MSGANSPTCRPVIPDKLFQHPPAPLSRSSPAAVRRRAHAGILHHPCWEYQTFFRKKNAAPKRRITKNPKSCQVKPDDRKPFRIHITRKRPGCSNGLRRIKHAAQPHTPSYRLLPMKNSATVPGPEWLPMTAPILLIRISCLRPNAFLISAASVCASSRQSPWLMKTG